jgi:transposase-like protein
LFSHVPSTKVLELAATLKAIHGSEDVAAAREKALQVIAKLRALRLPTAAELAATTFEETLSHYSFPEEHWRRIRTNNPVERSCVRSGSPPGWLALSRTANRLSTWPTAWSTKRYLNVELLKDQQMRRSHHGLSQSRAPPAQIKVQKNLDTTLPSDLLGHAPRLACCIDLEAISGGALWPRYPTVTCTDTFH